MHNTKSEPNAGNRYCLLDARKAELVKLRFFVGLNFAEAAKVLGISEATAKRDWAFARAWLYRRSGSGEPPGELNSSGG